MGGPRREQFRDRDGWWRSAVVHQVYPRSFADGDGDGIGDLIGARQRLAHVADLGADAVWFSPFYVSPGADGGYDVADYRDVDLQYGTLADAEELVWTAHDLGLRILLDLVPNHSSDRHARFQAALAAGAGSPERAWYHFADGRGPDGDLPPNDWQSLFSGPAWTRVHEPDGTPGQWYLHLFDAAQPDWNWDSEQVRAEFDDVLRFWLERGVDGFRVDVAHGLVKAPGLPSWPYPSIGAMARPADGPQPPMWDQPGLADVYRRWRAVLQEYQDRDGVERVLVGEAWLRPERLVRLLEPGVLHQAFEFGYLQCDWNAAALQATAQQALRSTGSVGAPVTWVLSNHDVVRHTTRLGSLERARAATALLLALPGSVYLYQGEELGLPEVTDLPDEVRTDPVFHRSGGAVAGRDGSRVPLPWEADRPAFGFSPSGRSWLPQPTGFSELAVDAQRGVEGSTLEFYRSALALRRDLGLGEVADVGWRDAPEGALRLERGDCTVLVNTTGAPVEFSDLRSAQLLLSSAEKHAEPGVLSPDSTQWLRS
jgi:alpha-glucosidase